MSNHPLNLALRFILEILGLGAIAFWGWAWGGFWRWPLAIGVTVVAMAVWAIFRTPGETAGGEGVVATPGPLRLLIEIAFFGLAVAALLTANANDRATIFAVALAVAVIIHYALSWDRVRWLLGR